MFCMNMNFQIFALSEIQLALWTALIITKLLSRLNWTVIQIRKYILMSSNVVTMVTEKSL